MNNKSEVEKRYTDYQNGYNTGKKVGIEECIEAIEQTMGNCGVDLDDCHCGSVAVNMITKLKELKTKSL